MFLVGFYRGVLEHLVLSTKMGDLCTLFYCLNGLLKGDNSSFWELRKSQVGNLDNPQRSRYCLHRSYVDPETRTFVTTKQQVLKFPEAQSPSPKVLPPGSAKFVWGNQEMNEETSRGGSRMHLYV